MEETQIAFPATNWDILCGRLATQTENYFQFFSLIRISQQPNIITEAKIHKQKNITDPRLQNLTFWKKPERSEESCGTLSGWEIRTTSSQVNVYVLAADTETEWVLNFTNLLNLVEVWDGEENGVVNVMGKAWEGLEMKREGILWERWR